MNQFSHGVTLFLSLLVEAMPFLLLGVLLSGLLVMFVDEGKLIKVMPKQPVLGALVGSMLGFLFPVCECGNVPVARRLIAQGVPAPVAVGFLLSAPTINPIVIWATWTAFRDQPEIVFLRVGFSLAIATIIGCVFGTQKDLRPFLQPQISSQRSLQIANNIAVSEPQSVVPTGTFFLGQPQIPLENIKLSISWSERFKLLVDTMINELRELGGILVLGSAIAAIIQVGIPRDIILNLGQGAVSSVIAMMTLAAVVSVCSTVDAFFALSFASTFTSGSILAFLVFGPMIDFKSIGLILTIFKKRAVVYLFLLAAQLTFLGCLFINLRID
ncbi:putative permease [Synechococcus sp. PCC 7502]|uniref:permease n=1 Tax=Synechococcus sp. PCC 7502 TaxID=1173263 RepID=UPI00029FB979|nr:permease [Synechococcus sp. PCC 7502]AFY72809.1 putative permease [Synechococcus sp. PCC 7502]